MPVETGWCMRYSFQMKQQAMVMEESMESMGEEEVPV
jgi:hypothetical protein